MCTYSNLEILHEYSLFTNESEVIEFCAFKPKLVDCAIEIILDAIHFNNEFEDFEYFCLKIMYAAKQYNDTEIIEDLFSSSDYYELAIRFYKSTSLKGFCCVKHIIESINVFNKTFKEVYNVK